MTRIGKTAWAAVLAAAWTLAGFPSDANERLTCRQLGLKEVSINLKKCFYKKHWGLTGTVTRSGVSYIKKGEYVGIAARKKYIYAEDANGVEYQSWSDICREKAVTACGVPVPPKFFRTADCKDISGDPIQDCKPGDPWQLWGIVFKGGSASGEPSDAGYEGYAGSGGVVAGGNAPVCADAGYCKGSGLKQFQEFTIESASYPDITTSIDLCRCPGRCGEVRRWAPGLREFVGDAVTVDTNAITVDKGSIRSYTPPKAGETAYLVWKPCGS